MKTKKVIMQVEVMTEALVNELNEVNERIEKLQSEKDNQYDFLLKSVSNIKDDIQSATHNRIRLSKDIQEMANISKEQSIQIEDIITILEKVPTRADVQTIAKHVQELEEKVDKLENYIYAKEKSNCEIKELKSELQQDFNTIADTLERHIRYIISNNSRISRHDIVVARLVDSILNKERFKLSDKEKIEFDSLTEKIKEYADKIDILRTPNNSSNIEPQQIDYFLKAKNLLIEYAEKTMIKKGIEYTPVGDRFANFRPILGEKKTALEKLIGYNAKHVQYCFMQETNMTAKTINELLEHWGDVFNYNVLGLAMQSTDKPNSVVPYADRPTQEKEIKNIVDSAKQYHSGVAKGTNYRRMYELLLNRVDRLNLEYIIIIFAKQLERLENSK